ncbi:protein VAC14 homolog isoform X1 [Amaranthus tricolor]|uniref:protein VAC14 homolog isoform X1 n=1 Tax=Amaranthus tricolor TaxID=29722 RepID=UPI002585956C|nr:protein VAC14 homolog isoform X1 [Amaranthus tricolor]XP_057528714.1 protein VAC14 homolog isoform X1 [Amaranthus tricolor]
MADALSIIPAALLRNLADKLYERRKNAALELEGIVKQLAATSDHEKITAVINLLTDEFIKSPQTNHRKGGLIGLAAATVGLTTEAAQHLEQIVPPVLKSFSDNDSRVRYYACEALYNIAKVVRGDFIVFFNEIFDALCKLSADSDANVQSAAHLLDRLVKDIVTESDQFSIEEFIPLLRERMNVLNPYVRQFLVGWITVLDSVPEIDMLGFLPDFLDGLFNMLSDTSHEIRQQADSALSEFLQEIKNSPSVDYGRMAEILVQRAGAEDAFTRQTAITWINEFVKLGGDQLVPYYADILGAILPSISDTEEKIRVVARETNEELRSFKAAPSEGFDVGAILSVAKSHLSSEWEATRIEALHWISTLLDKHRDEVLSFLSDIVDTLLKALSDSSDEVVLLVLEVHACIAKDSVHFRHLLIYLLMNFQDDLSLLEKRGALIIRRLCILLGAQTVYHEFSSILEKEPNLDFASIMVQALNLILLTSSELSELRELLKQSLFNSAGKDLFHALYASWCHSPMAIISLCLLAQTYQHASTVIQSLAEEDINIKFLVQLDKLIRLLETPTFAYLRLQLLEPGRYPWLLKALYGLLMLLPQQSAAFKILRTRLKTVPSYSFNGEHQGWNTPSETSHSRVSNHVDSRPHCTQDGVMTQDVESMCNGINFDSRLQQFQHMQQEHRIHAKAQAQLRKSSVTSTKEVPSAEEDGEPSSMTDTSQPPKPLRKAPGQGQL